MNDKKPTVGVVIVSYNASEAVRITLASLRCAHNDTPYKVILVDNASQETERAKIRAAMHAHIEEMGDAWRYIEQAKNLGFSGGNNVGIKAFLDDAEITHIVLLNSDVIVTDHWLDRLMASGHDIVSGVTNKADSEQCVPVTYQFELNDCLDHGSERIHESIYRQVAEFADGWYSAWRGNVVEADVTFFCVLVTVAACRKIGLLDEAFFPGGFEDDDYCVRARQAGYEIYLARDTFLHHWGSASFGKLQYDYLSDKAKRNRECLEKKHGITWQRRPEKPLVSFRMDVEFALKHADHLATRGRFLELYVPNLNRQINYFETEFNNLRALLQSASRPVPALLAGQVEEAEAFGALEPLWNDVVQRITRILKGDAYTETVAKEIDVALQAIARGIHQRVDCNFAIHAFLTARNAEQAAGAPVVPPPASSAPPAVTTPKTRFGRYLSALRKGLRFIAQFDGIVFFGGYFYPERQSDGYFQRIQIVDRLFSDRWRVYVEGDSLKGRNIWFDRPEPGVLVLRVNGSKKRRALVRLLVLLAVLRSRKVYFHSVLRMFDYHFGAFLRLPFIRAAVDIHGVVPEEFRMHNDFYSALIYENQERSAVRRAGLVIVVTEAMRQYLQQKFRQGLKAQSTCFPMFPSLNLTQAERPLIDGMPIVVYAGGLHKWQQVPKMVDAIIKTAACCKHRFYTPEPDVVRAMLPADLMNKVTVEAKAHSELMNLYSECHYGFILREDIIVNRVACPTKLVEYLAMGIVPIVDSEDIGDFKALGMQFVRLADFLGGVLPNEPRRLEMAKSNFAVYEALKRVREAGANDIRAYFSDSSSRGGEPKAPRSIAHRMLPPHTRRGKLARRLWRLLPHRSAPQMCVVSEAEPRPIVVPAGVELSELKCDILVQVDNFEAGGLENVALDLNRVLEKAGYRIVLLVLGIRGAAVQRAQELGQTVVSCGYSDQSYATLLDQLQPKLVLAHYSVKGVMQCKQRAIPHVQIIHNVYMWLTADQRREFAKFAMDAHTCVAVSDYVRRYSVSKLGVSAEKCTVIPNGIDFSPFDSLDRDAARIRLRAHYGIADDEFVFLSVGSINHQKNHLGTIKAFDIALQNCPRSRLLILGPVYEQDVMVEMASYIEKNGLQEKVRYCGTAKSAHEHMAMADCFVSGSFFEGSALTLLEAIKANLSIAVSNVGNASQYASMPGFQIVEPPIDMLEYDGCILTMTSNPAFELRLAQAMVRTYKERLRPDFSREQLAALEKGHTYAQYIEMVSALIGQASAAIPHVVDLQAS